MMFRRKKHRDDEPEVSIIDALAKLNDGPAPYGGDWTVRKVSPPVRQGRAELHITSPLRRPVLPQPRPNRGRVLKASRAMLPLFRETTRVMGWAAVMPLPRPAVTWTGAMRSIDAYSDKTNRVICSQVEAARADLRERNRDYDMREAEYRAKRPLTNQKGMLQAQAGVMKQSLPVYAIVVQR